MSVFADCGLAPCTGLCAYLDFETTGFSFDNHRVVQIGLGIGTGPMKPADFVDLYVQTPYDPVVWNAPYLSERFTEALALYGVKVDQVRDEIDRNGGSAISSASVPEEMRKQADDKGKLIWTRAVDIHKITPQKLAECGLPREVAMKNLADAIQAVADTQDAHLVGHNLWAFDLKFARAEMARLGIPCPELPAEKIIDTGLVVKASQLGVKFTGNLAAAYTKVSNTRSKGIKWALDKHCVPTYGLTEFGVDTQQQHKSAAYDCYVVNCLLRRLGGLG